jgi:hypothetical protein
VTKGHGDPLTAGATSQALIQARSRAAGRCRPDHELGDCCLVTQVLPGNPQHRDQPAPPRRDRKITFALQGITGDRTRALVFACETEITNGFSGPVRRAACSPQATKRTRSSKPQWPAALPLGSPWAPGDPGLASHQFQSHRIGKLTAPARSRPVQARAFELLGSLIRTGMT